MMKENEALQVRLRAQESQICLKSRELDELAQALNIQTEAYFRKQDELAHQLCSTEHMLREKTFEMDQQAREMELLLEVKEEQRKQLILCNSHLTQEIQNLTEALAAMRDGSDGSREQKCDTEESREISQ